MLKRRGCFKRPRFINYMWEKKLSGETPAGGSESEDDGRDSSPILFILYFVHWDAFFRHFACLM